MSKVDTRKQELLEEDALLIRLRALEITAEAATDAPFAKDLLILSRLFKRKRAECADYKDHLAHIRDFLKEAWDEEEEWFEPSNIERRVPGHWCPSMIEELDEMLEPGTVWTPV